MKPHHRTGNTSAKKPDGEAKESSLHVMCRTAEKAAWVRAAQAQGLTLAAWVRLCCNLKIGG